MIKKFKGSPCCDYSNMSFEDLAKMQTSSSMFSTKNYKPLSSYLAGAVDIDGDALRDNGSPQFDDSASSCVASNGIVDPFANPRVSVFDLVEQSGDPEAVESIRSTLGLSNPEQTTEQPIEHTTE